MPALPDKLTAYYRTARLRARRRKSAWNVLLLPICFGAWVGIWYALFRFVWAFHAAIYPDHRLADFWPRGVSLGSFALSFLMMFGPMLGAMALGFISGNCLVRLIRPARRAFDAEARGYASANFFDTTRDLFKVCVWVLPPGLAISLTAAFFLSSLR